MTGRSSTRCSLLMCTTETSLTALSETGEPPAYRPLHTLYTVVFCGAKFFTGVVSTLYLLLNCETVKSKNYAVMYACTNCSKPVESHF